MVNSVAIQSHAATTPIKCACPYSFPAYERSGPPTASSRVTLKVLGSMDYIPTLVREVGVRFQDKMDWDFCTSNYPVIIQSAGTNIPF